MQTKTVDPYYEWLGIPPKDQPPNHYRLLGLELFEENRNVIDAAANRQMSFIKEYQAGVDSELSQKLLNELSAARLCLLSARAKTAYDAQLRAKLTAQAAPAPAVPVPSHIRWRNESNSPPLATLGGCVPPSPLASAIPFPVATGLDARSAPPSLDATPSVVTGRRSGILPRSKARLGALAVAMGLMAAVVAIVLAFVLTSSRGPEPTSPADAMAQGSRDLPAKIENLEPFVAEPVTASEPATFSPPTMPTPEPARTAEPVESPPARSTTAVPNALEATQSVPPLGPVIVVERVEPVPVPMQQPVVAPVIVPSAELPTTTPPPVETLEQADKRLQAAAEQASSPAEHQAVAQEWLSLADKAILDSQTELAKRIVERALAAARKSESDDLMKQATLLWSELEQPLTDEVKEKARQRLRERER